MNVCPSQWPRKYSYFHNHIDITSYSLEMNIGHLKYHSLHVERLIGLRREILLYLTNEILNRGRVVSYGFASISLSSSARASIGAIYTHSGLIPGSFYSKCVPFQTQLHSRSKLNRNSLKHNLLSISLAFFSVSIFSKCQ